MNELTRKQREVKDRDELILKVGRKLFLDKGYHSVTMDMIAKEVEYSKGTIYQHYNCKECIISALCIRFSSVLLSLFTKVKDLTAPSWLKMLMLLEADTAIQKQGKADFELSSLIQIDAFSSKLDAELIHEMNCKVERAMAVVVAIVEEAIASGELLLTAPATGHSIAIGCWSMIEGTHEIINKHSSELGSVSARQLTDMLHSNSLIFLRGCGWNSFPLDDYGILKLSNEQQNQLNDFRQYCEQEINEFLSAQKI